MSKVTGSPKDETAGSHQFRCGSHLCDLYHCPSRRPAHGADGREEH